MTTQRHPGADLSHDGAERVHADGSAPFVASTGVLGVREPCDLHRDVLRTLSNPAKFPHLSDDDALEEIRKDLARCGECSGRPVASGLGRER